MVICSKTDIINSIAMNISNDQKMVSKYYFPAKRMRVAWRITDPGLESEED